MNVYEVIRSRRSVRTYQEKAVSQEALTRILETARMAPSGKNRQPWKFVVVTNKETRKRLGEAANNQDFVGKAPVVIAAVGLEPEKIRSCGIPADPVDVTIAIDHMTLAAVEEGLGTCWIGAFSQEKVREILRIPSSFKVIALLTLGYPADSAGAKIRKSLQEIVCYEKFS
ncbi:nitroreductase family protein [Candidatus Acetothermia bacterium]|nr:nitroreductase family protein [Candidatus Acetothermia bacterium]